MEKGDCEWCGIIVAVSALGRLQMWCRVFLVLGVFCGVRDGLVFIWNG